MTPETAPTEFRGQASDADECPYCRSRIDPRTKACTPDCPTGHRRVRRWPAPPSNDSPTITRFWDLLIELDYERFGSKPELSEGQRSAIRWWLK